MFGCNSTVHTDTKITHLISAEELERGLRRINNYNGGKVLSVERVSEFNDGKAKYMILYNWESYWSSDDY